MAQSLGGGVGWRVKGLWIWTGMHFLARAHMLQCDFVAVGLFLSLLVPGDLVVIGFFLVAIRSFQGFSSSQPSSEHMCRLGQGLQAERLWL